MSTLARILCAIDLEKASERAFDRALNLAIVGDAKLFILHATRATLPFSWRAGERFRYLTELRKRAEAAGVKVRVEEQHGDPARVIVFTQTPEKSTSSSSAPTGDVVGGVSGRDQSRSAFCAGQRGQFSSCRGTLIGRVCSINGGHARPRRPDIQCHLHRAETAMLLIAAALVAVANS